MDFRILEPITIIRCQWNGIYPKHFYISFLHAASEVPKEIGVDCNFEKMWLSSTDSMNYTFGLGNTAGAAQRAMYRAKRKGNE